MASPKKKVTLYFSSAILGETQQEAIRQDRSISWIMQAAWRLARDEVRRLPDYGEQAASSGDVPSTSEKQAGSL
ncbi:MAG TPA: TIGR04563 family protein [Polyangia bacterium]|nr:TIGR04563 family protein [Polyangia bacterium]HVZ88987.1 TIGR04563 family protein [Polyangia bacterium]